MLNTDDIKRQLKERLPERRYEHSLGVANVAHDLAKLYDANQSDAYLAGLLHDWDKCYVGAEIFPRADELGISYDANAPEMEKILHAHTAAVALKREFSELSDEVLSAIDSHTLGRAVMSKLDMIVYLADYIDPSRKRNIPFVPTIRENVGKLSLEELVLMNLGFQIQELVGRGKPIFSQTVEAYNAFLSTSLNRVSI
jgi:predicted HD superfamily hydrolase involved in NAD metabolism